jgi:hypothetical protein
MIAADDNVLLLKAAQETESQQQSFFLVNKKKIDAERKENPQYYAILVAIKTIPFIEKLHYIGIVVLLYNIACPNQNFDTICSTLTIV